MKYCKVCRKKPKLERRVDCDELVFCSDDCYEEYDQSYNDMDHPYIDDYGAIRLEYIDWMKNYEDDLYKCWIYGAPKKEDLIEGIDEFVNYFDDYYRLEGQDGILSLEIYNYLLAFEELKEVIAKWEVDEKELKKQQKALEKKKQEERT